MSLLQTIAGSSVPAELILLNDGDTEHRFHQPLSVRVRSDAHEQLVRVAMKSGLNRNHLKRLAISAFLDRIERDGSFHILPTEWERNGVHLASSK